jgi:sec-independent protein translocase protein TatB
VETPDTLARQVHRAPGEPPVFDLSITKLLVLAVLALVIFGPDQLPKMAGQFGRTLRDLRRMADKARADLQEGLGPEFADFDINDLHPRNLVKKHFLDDIEDAFHGEGAGVGRNPHPMDSGQRPPFDTEAT